MIPCLKRFLTDPPFISDGAAVAMLQTLEIQLAEHPAVKALRDKLAPAATVNHSGIATIPIRGALARNPDPLEMLFFGVEDTDAVRKLVEATADRTDVRGLVLDIDSPGGFITGGPELADSVRMVNDSKPVVAWTGGTMASLAYWVGSQAGTVLASRSAQVGSIGAYMTVVDYTRMLQNAGINVEVITNKEGTFKGAGITSLTSAQREHFQAQIQRAFEMFRADVTGARPQVGLDAMRGQTFTGLDAREAGLIDDVRPLEYAQILAERQARERERDRARV